MEWRRKMSDANEQRIYDHCIVRVGQLEAENEKLRTQLADVTESMGRVEERCAGLREACAELLEMAESLDPEWLHWPEMYEELRGLGVEV